MKTIRPVVYMLVGTLLSLLALSSTLVYAAELKGTIPGSINALDSGYAITRWPYTDGEIMIGMDAQVRALTTHPPHPEATQVVFRWIRPDNSTLPYLGPVPLTLSGDTWDGLPVWDAYETRTIDMLGPWGVQALFADSEGNTLPLSPLPTVSIRAISWHAVPEVPLGTIASLLGMFGGILVFAVFRKRATIPKVP